MLGDQPGGTNGPHGRPGGLSHRASHMQAGEGVGGTHLLRMEIICPADRRVLCLGVMKHSVGLVKRKRPC